MNQKLTQTELREKLLSLMSTLKNNREKVPLEILKTKYKIGYDALCENLKQYASDYAKALCLTGLRIHVDYVDEGVERIQKTIDQSGILKLLSKDVFKFQDMAAFESHCNLLRQKILEELEVFYHEHLGLYITAECMENPDVLPLLYCQVNRCVRINDTWIPIETYREATNNPKLSQSA